MIPVIFKVLRDKRWVLLGWSVGMIALTVLTVLFFPSFSQGDALAKLAESLPPQLKSFMGDIAASRHLNGYIGTQLFDLRLPLFMLIFGVVMAVNLSATEEEDGTLKILQSWGISRSAVVVAKFIALGILMAVVVTAVAPGALIGGALLGEVIDVPALFSALALLWLFAYGVAAFTLFIGFATGKKSIAIAVGSLFAFYNVFLSMLAPSVKEVAELYKFTLYYYFNTAKPMIGAAEPWHGVLLGVVSLLLLFGAIALYRRRDLRA